MNHYRTSLIIVLLAGAVVFFALDLQRFFTLDMLKAQQEAIADYRFGHPVLAGFLYCLIYVAVTGLSLPGAASHLDWLQFAKTRYPVGPFPA